MNIYESSQDYLEKILILEKENKKVKSIDVANAMQVTKQSAHRAIKNFKENDFIIIDEKGYISLTEKGKKLAMNVYEKHLTLSNFFISINVPEEIAYKDACKIEHDISDETFEAIKKLIKK